MDKLKGYKTILSWIYLRVFLSLFNFSFIQFFCIFITYAMCNFCIVCQHFEAFLLLTHWRIDLQHLKTLHMTA